MAQSFLSFIGVQPSTASINDSVLLIIDAQNEYANGLLTTVNVASTRKAIKSLLDRYRSASASIIHIIHETPPGAPLFTPNTPLAEEFEELKPLSGESIVVKNHPGAFTDTNLQSILEKSGKKQLVLTGYMAHVCVSTTARQAAERGYDVIIVREAVGDRDIPGVKAKDLVDTVLAELADAFGTVVGVDEIK